MGQLRIQSSCLETSIMMDQNRVISGYIHSPLNTAQANRAHEAEECKLARLRKREQKHALLVWRLQHAP
jgi:hypothetical protein